MKNIDPLKNDSLSDLIHVALGRSKLDDKSQIRKGRGGGLSSKGARGSFVREYGTRNRRVVIKALVLENKGKGWQERRNKHAQYIQRDGIGKDGEKSVAFNRDSDAVDVNEFLSKSRDDPHEFRFIISAEDADHFDLKSFTKSVMEQMENDLGTKLDWIAVNHYNTDNPHTHVVLRGIDENGKKLIIEKDYISHGMRNRAKDIVTRELGERTEKEIRTEIVRSVNKERVTPLDLVLEKMSDAPGFVKVKSGYHLQGVPIDAHYLEERLLFLSKLELAVSVSKKEWHIEPDFRSKLREMGMQGDIIKMMHRKASIEPKTCIIYKKEVHGHSPINGEVIARGIANELTDKEYVLLKTLEGQCYYVELDRFSEKKKANIGDIAEIELSQPQRFLKKSDYNIAKFAAENEGIYDAEKHLFWAQEKVKLPDGAQHEGYVDAHVMRMKFLESFNLVNPVEEKAWEIPSDLIERLEQLQDEYKKKFVPRLRMTVIERPEVLSIKDDSMKVIGTRNDDARNVSIYSGKKPPMLR